jgi:hypothetical protein
MLRTAGELRPRLPKDFGMRIAGIIVGVILILLGVLWTLQGSNVLAGSVMSGHSQWLYIGIVMIVVGVAELWWTLGRKR